MFDLKRFLLDLIFPIQCLGCAQPDSWLCQPCAKKIIINFESLPISLDGNGDLSGVWIAADYNQELLVKILHSFKYNFVEELGPIIADFFIKFLQFKIDRQQFAVPDLVLAVPLAKKRKLYRGFNQSEIFVKLICKKFGWAYNFDLILRHYHNRPQVGLKADDRVANVKDIFKVSDCQQIAGKKILLVDDVLTTGSTLGECAAVLKKAGAKEVWGLVLAKG